MLKYVSCVCGKTGTRILRAMREREKKSKLVLTEIEGERAKWMKKDLNNMTTGFRIPK